MLEKLERHDVPHPPACPACGRPEARYEIFHDVLAKAILAWRAQHVEARRVDEIRREEERKRDEDRARFARRLAIVLSVALVCLAGAVAWALVERENAQGDAKTAEANELATEALSVLPTDPELSLFQAAKAAERAETPAADAALRAALGQSLVRRTITPSGGASSAVVAPPGFLVLAPDGSARELGLGGATVRTLPAPGGRVTSIAADRSGRFVVTTDGNGVATVRALDGSRLARLTDRNPIVTAAFSPDGAVLATGGVSGGGRLWNWRAGRPLERLRVDDPVGSIVFSPRGERVALLSKNGNVDVFERASGQRIDLQNLLKGQPATRAVAFAANGSTIAGATDDGTVWVVDLASRPRLVTTLPGSGDGARSIAFNPSGMLVASGGADGSVTLSSPLGGPPVAVLLGHEGPVTSIAFDETGRTVVTASADGTVRVWDLSLAAPQTFPRPTVLAIDRSGLHAVTAFAGTEGNAAVWGVPRATLFRTLPARTGALGVSQAAFSDDGTFVVTIGANGLPQLWDWRKGRAFDASAGAGAPAGLLQGAQVSPDGDAVAAVEGVAGTSVARVWRREGSGLTRTATLRTRAPVRALAFSPDDRLLATAAGSGVVLWDWRQAEKVGGVSIASSDRRRPVSVIGVAFSPSGERLLLTGDDGVARVWDRRDGVLRAELEHTGLVSSDFGPTDDLVVTAGADGVARVWDVNAKTPVATLYGGTQELAGASIGRDARTIVTIGFDRRGRVFRCDACAGSTAELARLAAARLAPDVALLEADAANQFGRESS